MPLLVVLELPAQALNLEWIELEVGEIRRFELLLDCGALQGKLVEPLAHGFKLLRPQHAAQFRLEFSPGGQAGFNLFEPADRLPCGRRDPGRKPNKRQDCAHRREKKPPQRGYTCTYQTNENQTYPAGYLYQPTAPARAAAM